MDSLAAATHEGKKKSHKQNARGGDSQRDALGYTVALTPAEGHSPRGSVPLRLAQVLV